jgi:cell division protein FtsQ
VVLAGAYAAYNFGHFLLASPEMSLVHPEQVRLGGNHYVPRASVLEIFAPDRGKSVLRIPLAERRRELEAIPWIERAIVRRALPNGIEVEISERTPVAFLRQGDDMALVDAHGVILERPLEGDFHFPVVTGIAADMALEDREQRMQLFSGFTQQIESARPGAIEQVSVIDLSEEHDVRATLTGFERGEAAAGSSSGAWGQADAPVLVHFGDGDFAGKYRTLVEDIGQWRATAGRVESVDLRFSREAVVNPDTSAVAQQRSPKQPAARAPNHSR